MSDTTEKVLGGTDRLLGGRYRKVRELKSGGGVTTMVGVDTTTGADVVLKAVGVDAVSAGARMRLEHEAQVLRQLESPRLASIVDVVVDEGALFLVLPLALGETLERRLVDGPMDVSTALAVARELLHGLSEAHASGVVHRDVKPANVIVSGDASDLRLTVVDFGLARTGWLAQSLRELPVGTARYISPEQAGLLHHDVDERADLYSAGALLYECLSGRPPFEGDTVGGVIRALASERPARLRALGCDVPTALDEMLQRLLRKDPRDRYQTASAVLADLEQLSQRLAAGDPDPAIVVGMRDHRATITEPAFVGRQEELAVLDRELERARTGQAAMVLLEAESGGGKSRLLEELAHRSGAGGAWILRGQGLDQAASLPFQVLTGVAEEVLEAVRADGDLASALSTRLADHADTITSALPMLGELLPKNIGSLGKEEHGPARVLSSLLAFLDALGDPSKPALVLLDDCQWADQPTVRFLERWADERRRNGGATMVVAAFRSEEVGPDHPLRRVKARVALALPPFGESDVRGLVESMAGPLPDEAVHVVEELSAGSPFMASAVLRGLVEVGALTRDPESDSWEVDAEAILGAQSSRRAAAFLARRLQLPNRLVSCWPSVPCSARSSISNWPPTSPDKHREQPSPPSTRRRVATSSGGPVTADAVRSSTTNSARRCSTGSTPPTSRRSTCGRPSGSKPTTRSRSSTSATTSTRPGCPIGRCRTPWPPATRLDVDTLSSWPNGSIAWPLGVPRTTLPPACMRRWGWARCCSCRGATTRRALR